MLLGQWTLYQTTKILDQSKLKAFADDKIDVVEMMISLLDRVENTVGKGENAGYLSVIKSRDSVVKSIPFSKSSENTNGKGEISRYRIVIWELLQFWRV